MDLPNLRFYNPNQSNIRFYAAHNALSVYMVNNALKLNLAT